MKIGLLIVIEVLTEYKVDSVCVYVCVCREVDGGVRGCAVWECTSGARGVGSKGICVDIDVVVEYDGYYIEFSWFEYGLIQV